MRTPAGDKNPSLLRCFFQAFLKRPPARFEIPVPKRPKRLPLVWTPQEIAQLIEAAHEPEARVVIQLGYATGLCLSEMCQLRRLSLDPDHRTIWVRQGKGQKDRAAIYPDRLRVVMAEFLAAQAPSPWVFPSPTNPARPQSNQLAINRFLRTKQRAGLAREGGLHSLRHSFATHLIARGIDNKPSQTLEKGNGSPIFREPEPESALSVVGARKYFEPKAMVWGGRMRRTRTFVTAARRWGCRGLR